MPKVLFVSQDTVKKRCQIGIGDDLDVKKYTVSLATYDSLRCPVRGSEIGEEAMELIRTDDESFRAIRKAYTYLADHDRSKYALKMRLIQAGFSREASELAVRRCVEHGYLDENRQLERAVEREANYKLRGRYYIKRHLVGKGYSLSDIDRAIDLLVDRGDIDFDENFDRLCEKRGIESDEDRAALKYRFGYKI